MDKPIALHLHHVDGNSKNNSLSNLKILCPNCHSQTDNYAGRNKKASNKVRVSDEELINIILNSYSKREALLKAGLAGYGSSYIRINKLMLAHNVTLLPKKINENHKNYLEKKLESIESIRTKYGRFQEMFQREKIKWPNKEELENMLHNKSCLALAKELGVSDNAIRKKCRKLGINIKEISKWARKHG
jgi:hypothetical protein